LVAPWIASNLVLRFLIPAVVAFGVVGGCRDTRPVAQEEAPRGIVLILLDTVRADRLSVYGNSRETSPFLETLAARGTVFENSQAPSPWTVPTMASIFSGLYPSQHGAGAPGAKGEPRNAFPPGPEPGIRSFDPQVPTLISMLRDVGYKTMGFFGNSLINNEAFTQDFDVLRKSKSPVTADQIVDWGVKQISMLEGAEPFFLYLHFVDAHYPIEPPENYLKMFAPQHALISNESFGSYRKRVRGWGAFGAPPNIKNRQEARDFRLEKLAAYDSTIRFIDDQIARLHQEFERSGLVDETLFVVTADHGEEFWDHWEAEAQYYYLKERRHEIGIGHGHTLFQELVRVPLILAGPRVPSGKRIAARTPLVDLGVTVLDIAGLEGAKLGVSESLVPYLRAEETDSRVCLSEGVAFGHELRSLVGPNGMRLIWSEYGEKRDLLFNLSQDPNERDDLLEEQSEVAARIREELKLRIRRLEASALPPGDYSGVEIDQLRALGYVQ
jgi:arylsulfatase A-like enzyme